MNRKNFSAILSLFAAVEIAAAASVPPAAAAAGGRIASDGQVEQMKSMTPPLERRLRDEGRTRGKAAATMEVNGRKVSAPKTPRADSAKAALPAPSAWKVGRIETAKGAKNDDSLAAGAAEKAAKTVSSGDAAGLASALEKHFRDAGLYLCHVEATATNEAAKTVDFKVNWGHIRNVTIRFREQSWLAKEVSTNAETLADGRWFSMEQVRYRYLREVASSNVFNYRTLYDRFYQMNSHPDLTARISLAVPKGDEYPAGDDRVLDVDVEVQERMPLHFVFDVDNNGTDASENWMGRLTAQYLNLTKHDDVLTLNYQNSLSDIDALGGLAGSYYLPHTFASQRDFGLTVYGGWTDVDSEDVVPDIDVVGSGWFAGLQESVTVLENEMRSLRVSAGLVRRHVKDHLEVKSGGQRYRLEENEVTVMPFSFAAMYSEKKPDAFNGLNFATVEALCNAGDFLGTSDQREMELQRSAADKDYLIVRAQLARLQMLAPGTKTTGLPMLFVKLGGQWTDGPLIPAEQMGLGGDGSVRGYATREYLGDHGIAGTLELRTPILLGLCSRKAPSWFGVRTAPAKGPDDTPFDRLQFVLFADAGYIKIEHPLPGEEKDKALYSVGCGIRLALGEHFQVKCDVGFPLEETADSDDACLHFNTQVQF